MKAVTRGYAPRDSIYPARGLDTITPGTQLDSHLSPSMLNVDIVKGMLKKRRGYESLGGTFPAAVLAVVEFEDINGVKSLLAFTTAKQYIFDPGTETWLNITLQSGGNDVDWTGTEEDGFDWTIATGLAGSSTLQKWIIVTNGVDQPRYWDGLGNFKLFSPTGITGFVTCKTIAQFYNHIVMGNVRTGIEGHQVIYWSAAQFLLDFSSGDSGSAIITDIQGEIQRMLPLGERLVIYGDNSISVMTYVAGTIVFTIEHVTQSTRLVSRRAIVNIGPFHLFLSQENVHLFDGSRLTTNVGDRIFNSYRQELSYPVSYRASAFHDAAKQHVLFSVPKTEDEVVVYKLEYDLSNFRDGSKWTKSTFADGVLSLGFFSREDNLRWNSPTITNVPWNQTDMTWEDASTREGFPVRVFASASRLFMTDDALGTDDGEAIEAYWESPDFTVPESFRSQLGRWIEVELDLSGHKATIQYSTDEGLSFLDIEELTLSVDWQRYRIPIDIMARTLRIRVYNNLADSPFSLRWCRVWVKPGGAD